MSMLTTNFYYDNEISCKCTLNLPNVKDIGAGALENQVHISENLY